jgi:hypothetical protein
MKTIAINVGSYFEALKGAHPWRARRGDGSFLTFDFGPKLQRDGHRRGKWHLWVYLANWVLTHNGRELANSDSDHRKIDVAVRRLEQVPFSGVEFDADQLETIFLFDTFRLSVSPADYVDNPDERDEYWLLFLPDERVVTVGPGGVQTGSANE